VSFTSALWDVIPGDSRVLLSNVDGPARSLLITQMLITQTLGSVRWLRTPPGRMSVMVAGDPSPDVAASHPRSGNPDVAPPADARLPTWGGSTARRQVG